MEQQTKHLLILLSVILLTSGVLAFEHYTTQQLRQEFNKNITTLHQELATTQQELIANINDLKSFVGAENIRLENELSGKVSTVESNLNTTRKEQQKEFQTINGQIQESTTRITAFEDQLKNIQIKNKDFSAIIHDVLKAVVTLKTDTGVGSGVIISDKGYIVTNYHVIDGATQAAIRTYDNHVYPVKLVGAEKNIDLAVLKIESTDHLTALHFEMSPVNVGDKVIAVGNPAGLEFSVTEGIISATDRAGTNGVHYLQTDVSINPGNSGGPLIDIKSNIVGINTMKKENMEGLGFAIRADVVKQITDQIIEQYETAQQSQAPPQ